MTAITSRPFSNALSPMQTAVVAKAFNIVQSNEGKVLRTQLLQNAIYLRSKLSENQIKFIGEPSAIIPIIIGDEGLMRVTARLLTEMGIFVNGVEFPGVPKCEARLRIQIMSNHIND